MTRIAYPYLGTPGAMQPLVSGLPDGYPQQALQQVPTRNEVATKLLSSGTAVSRSLSAKRSYVLAYDFMSSAAVDLADAFYEGLYGPGPFVLVNPTVRNVLPLDQSTMGMRPGSTPGWTATAGTIATDTSAPPDGVLSGVLKWTVSAGTSRIKPGTAAGNADATSAPVYLPAEFASSGIWLKVSADTTCTLEQRLYSASTGSTTAGLTSKSIAVTTDWNWFTTTAAPEAGSGDLVLPRLSAVLAVDAPSVDIYLAAAQLEYADAATAFQRGYGCPRVIIPDTTNRAAVLVNDDDVFSSVSLQFAEV